MSGRVLAYCDRGHALARLRTLDADWWEADDWYEGPRWLVAKGGDLVVEVADLVATFTMDMRSRPSGALVPTYGPFDALEAHEGEVRTVTCPQCRRSFDVSIDNLVRVRADPAAKPVVCRRK